MYVEAGPVRKPIGVLMIEHRLIERALNVLEDKVNKKGAKTDVIAFAELIDFFRVYADETHHGKEEDVMFIAADNKKLPPEGLRALAELRDDHVKFRGYRRAMDAANRKVAAGDKNALKELVSTAKTFIPKLREHIQKEDKIFFPIFDRLEQKSDRDAMMAAFKVFDAEKIHQTFKSVVDRNE